jgi:hypothetical protein
LELIVQPKEDVGKATVTYYMNLLQGFKARAGLLCDLNDTQRIRADRNIRTSALINIRSSRFSERSAGTALEFD